MVALTTSMILHQGKSFYNIWNTETMLVLIKHTDKVLKAINKDEQNNNIIPFPKILTRFIPDLHLTPQGFLIKPGGNDRPM